MVTRQRWLVFLFAFFAAWSPPSPHYAALAAVAFVVVNTGLSPWVFLDANTTFTVKPISCVVFIVPPTFRALSNPLTALAFQFGWFAGKVTALVALPVEGILRRATAVRVSYTLCIGLATRCSLDIELVKGCVK